MKIIEHSIPWAYSRPYILTFGPDGGLWFCDNGAGEIGRMDISCGAFRAFALPRRDCQPVGIITGHDGHLWFTEYAAHKVGRMTLDGQVTEFDLPTPSAGPTGIIDGPDGNVWLAESEAGQIACISPDGIVSEQAAGNLWFTENAANKIGQMKPDGSMVGEYDIPTFGSGARAIVGAPDGRLFFSQYDIGRIGEVRP
jgi:virginiamycin B lyase